MPELPRYNSQAKLNIEPNAVVRNDASQPYDIMQRGLEQTSDIIMKWAQAVDTMQETAVKVKYAQGLAQIESDAINDTDINNEKTRIEEIRRLRTSVMENGLQNKSLQQKLGMELDTDDYLATLKINNIYAKKKMLADILNTANLLENYSGIRSQALQAGNQTVIEETDKKAFELIQGKVATQIMTEAQGKEAWKNYRLGSVDYDIQSDPSVTQKGSGVLQALLKGKDGRYSFLTNEELSEKIKSSKINIWRNKVAQEKAAQENNTAITVDLSQKLSNGTLSMIDIDKAGKIDPKIGATFANAIDIKQRNIDDPENNTANFLLKLLDNNKMTALEVLNKAAEYRETKNFNDTTYAWVVQEVAKKAEREKKGLSGWSDTTNIFVNGVKSIISFANILNPFGLANIMIGKYTQKVKEGKDPQIAEQEVVKEQIDKQLSEFNANGGYTEEDIQYTMKKRNLTREEVIKRLGVK